MTTTRALFILRLNHILGGEEGKERGGRGEKGEKEKSGSAPISSLISSRLFSGRVVLDVS